MIKKTPRVIMIAACLMSIALMTACDNKQATDLSNEEAQQIVEEAAEDVEEAEDEINETVDDIDEAANEVIDAVSGDLDISGSWQDEVSQRACMDAVKNSDGSYDIKVSWGGSAFETSIWEIHGTYDSASGMIAYEDGAYSVHTYDEDGNETISGEELTKGAFMKEGDKLRWQDSKNSEDGMFVKIPDDGSDEVSESGSDDYISTLPDYIYIGDDPIMSAVTQYLIVEYKGNYSPCDVSIPCPVIVDKDETDSNDIKVWGNFWLFNYMMDGDVLVSESGGSYPGLMHLKSTDNGYEVTDFEVVADGSDSDESARKIFGDRYDKYIQSNADEEADQKIRTELISDYVKGHGLYFTKYQDYGQDPVELPQ